MTEYEKGPHGLISWRETHEAQPGDIPACRMSGTTSEKEAAIYLKLRGMHCAAKKPGHECHGRISLDRNGITAQCPLCGDWRALYPKGSADDAR